MVRDILLQLDDVALDYVELDEIDAAAFNATGALRRENGMELRPSASGRTAYDFIIFNYHPFTMAPHLSAEKVKLRREKTFSIVLEIEPDNPYAFVPPEAFDGLIVLDPTVRADGRAWPFPRPLSGIPRQPEPRRVDRPTIGSFGLATPGKGFELLMSAVNLEFDSALVRINISPSTYADPIMQQTHRRPFGEYLGELCKQIAKPGIDVEITHEFMSDADLLDWCEGNDINAFMYTRRQSGLSATTDQAIMSGRPLLISANDTFRHIHPYILPYPRNTLRDAMAHSTPAVRRMQQDWSVKAFADTFRQMLQGNGLLGDQPALGSVETGPVQDATQPSVLVVIPGAAAGGRTLLDWEERAWQTLCKSSLVQASTIGTDDLTQLESAVFWSRCTTLLVLQEHATIDPPLAAMLDRLAAAGLQVRCACRGGVDAAPEGWTPLGPIIPFFTLVLNLPEGPPIINLYGFESGKYLAEVAGKVRRELPAAEIVVHVPTELGARVSGLLDHRLARIRDLLRASPGITIARRTMSDDAATAINELGTGTCNLFCADSAASAKVANLLDLAMAADRVVSHTIHAPIPAYAGLIPIFEAQSLPELIKNGTAEQIAGYNRNSEGRVLLALEELLGVPGETREGCTPRSDLVGKALVSVNANAVLDRAVGDRLVAAAEQLRSKNQQATIDELYRPDSMRQQAFLLLGLLWAARRQGETLIVGDQHRYMVQMLRARGTRFDHCSDLDTAPQSQARYRTVMLANAVSGADELAEALETMDRSIEAGGFGVLTFFYGETYNVEAASANADIPTLTRIDLEKALRRVEGRLLPVTTPNWRTDRPDLSPDPFALPAFGTLTVRKAAHV